MADRRREPMKVMLTLRPGQRGTKALVDEYGDRLICVRYRYDAAARKRYKTIEIIIESGTWYPPREPDEIVAIRLVGYEPGLLQRIKTAGGRWDPTRKLWMLRYHVAIGLGVRDRIVDQ